MVYIALGTLPDGTEEILGLWIEQTERTKFWMRVMNELRNRGVADILIAVVDGLSGFPEAINAVFPQTVVQTCIGHLIRNSMGFASWKDRKAIAGALCGDQVILFSVFGPPICRIIYTLKAIGALNSKLRRAVRTRGHLPGNETAMKLLYLALNRAVEEWKRPPREWCEAKTQFSILFGGRFVV